MSLWLLSAEESNTINKKQLKNVQFLLMKLIVQTIDRRKFLHQAATMTLGAALLPNTIYAAPKNPYKIGVIDLMMLKRQKISALDLTHELGADGVEVDMGGLGNRDTFDSKLGDPVIRKAYLDKLKALNIEICSLAMTGFYAQSLAKRPTYQQMVQDCIDTMKAMGVKIAFLPLGIQCDLNQYPELRPILVERLQVIGKMAAREKVTIGIETALDAKGEKKFLDDIGSTHIRSYFNFSNALKNGRDLHQELQILGKEYICQIHCTDEDGVWLENNKRLNMRQVKQTLDDMGWRGWLVIERSRDANDPRNVKANFGANTRYMKLIFQT
ncbi:sugar phosphate isomerase/epimerase family protein [Olivibacter domesticus]|uniref:Sugar phosphate isomerase/epimerase n=1 Tax=Olivibacter domesticus TaxID=407022 RepID=A0A1H7TZC0_OLID1|nr:sugar phosphate isomerase/epimerase family protein [Olivibacter domesticus]SEL90180.1 Sugar phosphate isomerase/epimerase [Olivibacter domesticus]